MDNVRLIDANALCEDRVANDPVVIAAKCAPTIDAVPVVHGRWVRMDTTGLLEVEAVWNCSACGYPVGIWTAGSKYCPDCGAKMDGGVEG